MVNNHPTRFISTTKHGALKNKERKKEKPNPNFHATSNAQKLPQKQPHGRTTSPCSKGSGMSREDLETPSSYFQIYRGLANASSRPPKP